MPCHAACAAGFACAHRAGIGAQSYIFILSVICSTTLFFVIFAKHTHMLGRYCWKYVC